MAGIDDLVKGKLIAELTKSGFAGGAAAGAAVGVAATLMAPVALSLLRPVAKNAIKWGIIAFERGREGMAEFGEVVEDAVAEAREELGYRDAYDEPPFAAAGQATDDGVKKPTGPPTEGSDE